MSQTSSRATLLSLLDWYDTNRRDLPWREGRTGPWGVLVSEFMLQQTQVSRVLPIWHEWLRRWPTPTELAKAPAGEAVRMWGRLGYPRRALRLHAAATAIRDQHEGQVPADPVVLQSLPGVGAYTAAAVAAFAFGARIGVVDTNVRRVLHRLFLGADSAGPATAADRELALSLLPVSDEAARMSVALMEFGALVCTARNPRCGECPVSGACRWQEAGAPASPIRRRTQQYAGTDRQVRGLLLAALRESSGPVPKATLDLVWDNRSQRERALDSLLDDGLVQLRPGDRFALPG